MRLALLALLALVLQNLALAAYDCPQPLAASTMAAIAHGPASPMDGCGMAMPEKPTLCEKHCDPDDSATTDARVASVPAPALPPMRFDPAHWQAMPASAAGYRDVPVSRGDPPPTLRFCTLLI